MIMHIQLKNRLKRESKLQPLAPEAESLTNLYTNERQKL